MLPLNLYILRQVHRAFCLYVHRFCTTTTWNDQMLLSSLEKGDKFYCACLSSDAVSSFIWDNLDEKYFELGPEFNFSVAFSLALPLSDLKVPFVSRRKEVITY